MPAPDRFQASAFQKVLDSWRGRRAWGFALTGGGGGRGGQRFRSRPDAGCGRKANVIGSVSFLPGAARSPRTQMQEAGAEGPTPDAPGGAGSQTAPSRPTSRRESGGPRSGASARPPVPQGHGAGRGRVPTGTPGRRGCWVWVCRTALSARCGGCDRSLPCLSAKTSRGPALVTLGPTLRSLDPQNCLSGKGALPGLVKSPLT